MEHSALFFTFIKLPFVIKTFVLSIYEWPFYTGFTVIFINDKETMETTSWRHVKILNEFKNAWPYPKTYVVSTQQEAPNSLIILVNHLIFYSYLFLLFNKVMKTGTIFHSAAPMHMSEELFGNVYFEKKIGRHKKSMQNFQAYNEF